MNQLKRIILRIVSAAAGFFVVFDIYFLIRTVMKSMDMFKTIGIHDLWYRAYLFFTLPFTDTVFDVRMLKQFSAVTPVIRNDPAVHAYIQGLWSLLIQHGVLFLLVIACIALYERRKEKSKAELMVFYGLIPPVIWLVWLIASPFLP